MTTQPTEPPLLRIPPIRRSALSSAATAARWGVVVLVGSLIATPLLVAVAEPGPIPVDVVWRSVWSSVLAASLSMTLAVLASISQPATNGQAATRPSVDRLFASAVDLPLVLPPVVIGLALLSLLRGPLAGLDDALSITATAAAVVLAQFAATLPLACRLVDVAVHAIDPRPLAAVATAGGGAMDIAAVRLREAAHPLFAVATLIWAAAFATFGPVLVFAGVTAGRTEVLSTVIYLNVASGELAAAARLSAVMIAAAAAVTIAARCVVAERQFHSFRQVAAADADAGRPDR